MPHTTMQELKTSLLPVPSQAPGQPGDRHMLLASSKETRALCNQQSQVSLGVPARLSPSAPSPALKYLIS